MKKTAFESLSHDFSSFKIVVVKNKSRKPTITQKTTQPEKNLLPQDIDWRHAILSCATFVL